MKRYLEKRPWGGFRRFTLNESSTVKILTIKPRQEFSLQYHKYRDEFWRFLDAPAIIRIGRKTIKAKKGDEFFIPMRKEVNILEISFGKFDERDILRIKDKYGRI